MREDTGAWSVSLMGWLISFTAAFFAFAVPGGTASSWSTRGVLPAHPILRTTRKRSQSVNVTAARTQA